MIQRPLVSTPERGRLVGPLDLPVQRWAGASLRWVLKWALRKLLEPKVGEMLMHWSPADVD
jgi:hypothetical protein